MSIVVFKPIRCVCCGKEFQREEEFEVCEYCNGEGRENGCFECGGQGKIDIGSAPLCPSCWEILE